jgi:hypothetical protein
MMRTSNFPLQAHISKVPLSCLQGPDMSVSFPNIKAIMWFDELKVEAQAGGAVIDWRFTGNQQIQSGLGIYLQVSRLCWWILFL